MCKKTNIDLRFGFQFDDRSSKEYEIVKEAFVKLIYDLGLVYNLRFVQCSEDDE